MTIQETVRFSFSIVITFLVLTMMACCTTPYFDDERIVVDIEGQEAVVEALNASVGNLIHLAEACIGGSQVSMFTAMHNSNKITYLIELKDGSSFELDNTISSANCSIPELSFAEDNGLFYWLINDQWLFSSDNKRVSVTDKSSHLLFFQSGGQLFYSCGDDSFLIDGKSMTNSTSIVNVDYDSDTNALLFLLPTKTVLRLKLQNSSSLIKQNVLNEVYYKDVFLDAGVGLTSRKTLAAARALKLSIEGVCFAREANIPEEIIMQNGIIAGDETDSNGRLLYPDGQPRYKLLFVNGGSSVLHGKSLSEVGLQRFKDYVQNGGSYVGTCAGAFFASNGYDSNADVPYYLNVWPGIVQHTGISKGATDITLEVDSPLFLYSDFGGDSIITDVRHNGGGFPLLSHVENTEVLARYCCPNFPNVHGKPCVWAYKKDDTAGRVVLEGSHPEEVNSGEQLELTSSLMRYAMDGRGVVTVKGFLKNGEPRQMNKNSSDNQPAYTRIGDYQCHHFSVYIPEGAKDISIVVDSDFECDMILRLCNSTYAFPSTADYCSANKGHHQELRFSSLSAGVWYVSVQCITTVDVMETDYGQSYSGRLDILDGVPYSVLASWTL